MTEVEYDPAEEDAEIPEGPQYSQRPFDIGVIIPYRNPPALIAYYCDVFAIFPCFPMGLAGCTRHHGVA